MQSASPYKPYRTDERNPPLSDDYLTRHKNALFEPFKSESPDRRADALAQIGSSLLNWSHLAYPELLGRSGTTSSVNLTVGVDDSRPELQRDQSNEGVFNIDDDEVWSDRANRDESREQDAIQTPPWSAKTFLRRQSTPDQDGYSYYGTDEAIFNVSRSTNELKEILKSYLLTVLRASVDCPFADVRRYCRYILNRIQLTGASVPDLVCDGPSWLIPAVETIAFGHDAASEKSHSSIRHRQLDEHRSGSWISSSFSSETSELSVAPLASMKRIRSGIMTPIASPSKSSLSQDVTKFDSSDNMADDVDGVVFESDQESETSSADVEDALNSSVHASPTTKATASAIPIGNSSGTSRTSPRFTNAPTDIDDILLGPIGTRTKDRKARFSIDPIATTDASGRAVSQVRPSLGRKRTNSTTYTIHQRRASRSLRTFHLSCYTNTGRISNFGKILSYFPRFYESEIIVHDELIRKEGGPLPRNIKLYLAIMAASQAKCQYLVSYFSKKFVQLGVNQEWLEDLDKAPRKLQRLGRIVAILTKQPWAMQKQHIEELLSKSKESIDRGDSSDQWTMGELVQTFCIIIVVNCQAHFCLATGIVPEADTFGGACIRRQKTSKQSTLNNSSVDVFPLFTSYDSRAFASPASHNNSYKIPSTIPEHSPCMLIPTNDLITQKQSPSPIESDDEETIPSLLWKRRQSFNQTKLWTPKTASGSAENNEFHSKSVFAQCAVVDDQDTNITATTTTSHSVWNAANLRARSPGANGLLSPIPADMDVSTNTEAAMMPVNPILEDMDRFSDVQYQLPAVDFDLQNSSEYTVLRLADCNWEDHTCSLIGRFVPNLETVLDQNLQEARVAAGDDDEGFFFNSTDGSSVDQGPLRDAVWFFILRLYGIYHDGYAYTDVNLLLNSSAKKYLKKICMRPEGINRADWKSIGKGLKSQERVLLALLATHARMYACLVYAFRYCQ